MILVDTGPLVAALVSTDDDHERCVRFFDSYQSELLVTPHVVHETCYLVERDMGPKVEAAFMRSIARGELTQVEITPADAGRIADLVDQYADFPLGAADASVVAVAERLDIRQIATLDHRHFRAIVPGHVPAFRVLPD
jgi:uncharacterized protein